LCCVARRYALARLRMRVVLVIAGAAMTGVYAACVSTSDLQIPSSARTLLCAIGIAIEVGFRRNALHAKNFGSGKLLAGIWNMSEAQEQALGVAGAWPAKRLRRWSSRRKASTTNSSAEIVAAANLPLATRLWHVLRGGNALSILLR
jgi:hypothetical protein